MAIDDPLVSAWFSLEMGGKVTGAFRECTGLGSSSEVVEYKASLADNAQYFFKKVPGRMKWEDVVLKRGITELMDMWEWRKLVEEGKIDEARINATINMHNQEGEVVATWELINAWPSKISGPAANGNNNEIAIEELTLVHEYYERVK